MKKKLIYSKLNEIRLKLVGMDDLAAIHELDDIIEKSDKTIKSQLFIMKANRFWLMNNRKKSLSCFESTIKEFPEDLAVLFNFGLKLFENRDFGYAKEKLSGCITKSIISNDQWYLNSCHALRAICLLEENKMDEANIDFSKVPADLDMSWVEYKIPITKNNIEKLLFLL